MTDAQPSAESNVPTRRSSRKEPIQRIASAVLCAVGATLCVSACETVSLTSQYPHPSLGALATFGLLAPWGCALGAVVGGLSSFQRRERLGLLALRGLADLSEIRRRQVAAVGLLAIPAALLWLLTMSGVARSLLSSEWQHAPAALGLGLAVALVTLCLSGAVVGGARYLADRLRAPQHPGMFVTLAALSSIGLLGVLIAVGNTSGAGGAPTMFGVLRRSELDLRAPLYFLLAVACAYQLPAWLRRVPTPVGLAAAVLSVSLTPYSAKWLDAPELNAAVERRTALAKRSLALFQAWDDADDDGYARHFGGADCNDAASRINPGAEEIPGNGVDEDCTGADALPPPSSAPGAASAPNAAPPPADNSARSGLPENPAVILITIDTLRLDLGFTGYAKPITPNLDALARRSVVFEKAYALASYTSKSMGPLLIGRYGSETHRGFLHFNLYNQDRMLQERLRAAHVRTVSVQGHWYFKANTGLGRGFDVLDLSASPPERQGEGDRTVYAERITDAALTQLRDPANTGAPLFMWVHYLDPHAEYVPHPGFDFGTDERGRYDGEVAFTDHHVGRLLDALQASPLAQRAIVIVTSDHGEAFGEHGMTRHGFELWEVLVRVPLLVYVPGRSSHTVSVRRGAIDLAPTILDLFGLPIPARTDAEYLSGESMLSDVLLPEGYQPQERPIFLDMPAGPYNGDRQALIEGNFKLITSKVRPMGVYDLAQDPGETHNLMSNAELTQRLLARFRVVRSALKRVEEAER